MKTEGQRKESDRVSVEKKKKKKKKKVESQ